MEYTKLAPVTLAFFFGLGYIYYVNYIDFSSLLGKHTASTSAAFMKLLRLYPHNPAAKVLETLPLMADLNKYSFFIQDHTGVPISAVTGEL